MDVQENVIVEELTVQQLILVTSKSEGIQTNGSLKLMWAILCLNNPYLILVSQHELISMSGNST